MKKAILTLLVGLAALPVLSFAQDGVDISTAIPIYFGQTISDNLDSKTRPNQVYSIALGKGQQFSVTANANAGIGIWLGDSSVHTVNLGPWLKSAYWGAAESITYQTAASGVYYIQVAANATGITFRLQVSSQGPIVPANACTPSGAPVSGPVDSMTYSLGLIAAGLPDEVSVGGTRLCGNCTLKPPAYPELVAKIEKAMGLGLNVSAGFDSNGNMCQLKLVHP